MRNTRFPPAPLATVEPASSTHIEVQLSSPGTSALPSPDHTQKSEPDRYYGGLISFMSRFGLGQKDQHAEAMPTLPQLLQAFDTTDIPGIRSVPHDPDNGMPLWKDDGAPFQKPFVRVFTLNSLHEKYKGISLEQRLDNEIEAATAGGVLRTANEEINQVGIASTRLGPGIWRVWGGEIGFLFSPDTPVSLKSKKDFYSNGLIREKCYQSALHKKKQGANPDFATVHHQADKNRSRGSRMLESEDDETIKFYEMSLRQQKVLPDHPTKTILLKALKEADPEFKPESVGTPANIKKTLSHMLLEKGDVRNLALISPALEKMEKNNKSWRINYLAHAEKIERNPQKYGKQKYAGIPGLPTNEQLILPGKDGNENVAAIFLASTAPAICRLALLLRQRFENSQNRKLPFAIYDGETGDIKMLSVESVDEYAQDNF